MRTLIISCLLSGVMLLTACGRLHIYQPNVQQGNLVTTAEVAQIRVGMSKAQVVDVLGEPVLSDTFDDNHWAYVYTFQRNGGAIQRSNFDVYFQNGRVTRFQKSQGMVP